MFFDQPGEIPLTPQECVREVDQLVQMPDLGWEDLLINRGEISLTPQERVREVDQLVQTPDLGWKDFGSTGGDPLTPQECVREVDYFVQTPDLGWKDFGSIENMHKGLRPLVIKQVQFPKGVRLLL
jgi:hypothetical protein